MITANVLILNALKAIGIECEIGDQPDDGYYFNAGLSELNSLITELNIQDYLAEARKEKLVRAGGKIRIGDSADYEIIEKEPPVNIKSLSRKMGLSYYKLIKCDKARIYSQSRTGLANLYTYNIEHDEDRHCMYGEIFTDGGMTSDFLVIYNKGFPQYKGDDEIWFSEMSINLLEEGLKCKLRYYQKTGYKWLKTLDNYKFGGILADDMGLGKTIQVIAVILDYVNKEGKMKAVVSITLDDEFVVHDIKVIEGEKGLFIAMPSKKSADGEYRDIAHPINSGTRERIQNIILAKYEEAIQQEDVELT